MSFKKLDRREAVSSLLEHRANLLIVSGLGSPTYDVHAAGDCDQNFYLWGAMGGAAMMGLGLAIARPEKSVLVITGDGEQLMGIGGLATIGVQKPKNLTLAILDNGHFGETGMQKSHTSHGVDLVTIARGSGFFEAVEINNFSELNKIKKKINLNLGSLFINIKIDNNSHDRSLPTLDGVEIKNRFRRSLN
ncbi:MAG: thiamine pyrophosphate-dependent enzyme [Paracoccaceae bacterium]|jgi:phosphonopyruvate decarboxylase|nr:thiamine pyrophosphate-dependent enzyme [Paracoccaceae bacterium]